jgi:hypothetical protein
MWFSIKQLRLNGGKSGNLILFKKLGIHNGLGHTCCLFDIEELPNKKITSTTGQIKRVH